MPILERKYNHTKVYRPNGALYAEAKLSSNIPLQLQFARCVEFAFVAFRNEFGRNPKEECCVIEAMSDSVNVTVTLYEIPEKD